MIPSPIPGTPCVPHRCSLISGPSDGSTAYACTPGSCALSARATPVDPAARPLWGDDGVDVAVRLLQISSPDTPWAAGLSGFSNSPGK